jgi:hypothetical protein
MRRTLNNKEANVLRAMHIAGPGAAAADVCRIAGIELTGELPPKSFGTIRGHLVQLRLAEHHHKGQAVIWQVTQKGRLYLRVLDDQSIYAQEERDGVTRIGTVESRRTDGGHIVIQVTWLEESGTGCHKQAELDFEVTSVRGIATDETSVALVFMTSRITLGGPDSELAKRVPVPTG